MALNEDVVDSVANTNFKVVAEQQAQLANLSLQNAVNFQQGMNAIFASLVGKIGEVIVSLNPSEALGEAVVGQQASKVAGNTPPVTP